MAIAMLTKSNDTKRSHSLFEYVGMIVVNLQSLEFALRLFLYDAVGPIDQSFRLSKLSVGDSVPETPLTNWDTLGTLIDKVNEQLKSRNINEKIDRTLVDLRDSIAHGRALASAPNAIPRLFKFSQPTNGFVRVKTSVDLTKDWLSNKTHHIFAETQKIVHISRQLGFPGFPDE